MSLLFVDKSSAQLYCNEWINYNQTYFKIPITDKGLYRLTHAQLAVAGFNVTNNPQKIQIFHRGVEQAISVQGEADGVFDATDYVDFFGKNNDGTQDRELHYPTYASQINPYKNIYSDTTAYFITQSLSATNGKRMSNLNLPSGALVAQPYIIQEELQAFAEQFSPGASLISNIYMYLADFGRGKGVTSSFIGAAAPRDFTFNITNPQGNITPTIEISYVSRGLSNTTMTFSVGSSTATLRPINTTLSGSANFGIITTSLLASDFPAGNGQFILRAACTGAEFSVNYIKLRYAKGVNANSQTENYFNTAPNPSATSLLNIANVPAGSILYDITNTTNIRQIASANNPVIDNTLNERSFFLTNNFRTPLKISQISFQSINPLSFDYLMISNNILRKPAGGYSDPVRAYADYRASVQGGNYKPILMDIEVLYNQFNYGERSSVAIRNFAKFMYDGNPTTSKPKALFLLGRAISLKPTDPNPNFYYIGNISFDIRNNPLHAAQNLVPTHGYPGSDIPLTAGFDGLTQYQYANTIPTGRLSANIPLHVANYLTKVKEHENPTGSNVWRKNMLFLSGGISQGEQANFRNYVNNYKNIIEGDFLRGTGKIITKTTTNNVQYINIADEINAGIGQLTFFGHSSAIFSEIDIGSASQDVQGYRNKGKYPLILANGCLLGNLYSGYSNPPYVAQADDWMLLRDDRGAIAWIANAGEGIASYLNFFSTLWHNAAYGTKILLGEPLGVIHRAVVTSVNLGNDPITRSQFQQMTLQADPAVRLVAGNKPDYYTDNTQISLESFNNSLITARSDSFKIRLIANNQGISDTTKFRISVKRTLSNGSIIDYTTTKRYKINNTDTLYFTVKRPLSGGGFGNNRFEVKLDYLNQIPELSEDNNVAVLEYLLPDIGAKALFPPEYSVIGTQPIRLIAQAGDLANIGRDMVFEVDTSSFFNSPIKRSNIIRGQPLPTWEFVPNTDVLPSDSIVYYWRVNFVDAVGNATILWDESSFIYIKNSPSGWSQARFPQFYKSKDVNIEKDKNINKWKYKSVNNRLRATTYGETNPLSIAGETSFYWNSAGVVVTPSFFGCANNSFLVIAFDKRTKLPYLPAGVSVCGQPPFIIGTIGNASVETGGLAGIIGSIPTDDYVLVISKGTLSTLAYNTARTALLQIGASPAALNTLLAGHPYILLGKKGLGSNIVPALQEIISTSITNQLNDVILMDFNLDGGFIEGNVTSTRIGPASAWGTVFSNYVKNIPTENSLNDQNELIVLGEKLNGQIDTLIRNVPLPSLGINTINAQTYPYLYLNFKTKDEITQTPSQLKRWQVLYSGVPEGYINIAKIGVATYTIPDKQEGQDFELNFAFDNIGQKDYNVDSLLVEYTIINATSNLQERRTKNIKAPKIGESVLFSLSLKTLGKIGKNTLRVFVNPRLQLEQLYDNNILETTFNVIGDNRNPLLDVTFDGAKIMDNEIVSASPLINIILRDDNQFLVRTDTSGLDIRLKSPCANCNFKQIYFSNPNLRFRSEKGKYIVDFNPQNLPDGTYTLQVQGTDAKGNRAGEVPYLINFQVINESTVTNVYPYPNPFSGSTRFVFTLTGSQIPDQMKIQIMTVTGKVVKEILQDEIGFLRVGNNISEYAWDGTDEFGDKLANGVYLYKVQMRINGQQIKHRDSAGDKAFKKDFGKMYILR